MKSEEVGIGIRNGKNEPVDDVKKLFFHFPFDFCPYLLWQ